MSKYIVEYKSLNKHDSDTISLNIHKFKRAYISSKKIFINPKSFQESIQILKII